MLADKRFPGMKLAKYVDIGNNRSYTVLAKYYILFNPACNNGKGEESAKTEYHAMAASVAKTQRKELAGVL